MDNPIAANRDDRAQTENSIDVAFPLGGTALFYWGRSPSMPSFNLGSITYIRVVCILRTTQVQNLPSRKLRRDISAIYSSFRNEGKGSYNLNRILLSDLYHRRDLDVEFSADLTEGERVNNLSWRQIFRT